MNRKNEQMERNYGMSKEDDDKWVNPFALLDWNSPAEDWGRAAAAALNHGVQEEAKAREAKRKAKQDLIPRRP